jgi:hypothetical protein
VSTKKKSKITTNKSGPIPAASSGTGQLLSAKFLAQALACLGGAAGARFDALAACVALAVGRDACLAACERAEREGRHPAADLDDGARMELGARYLLEEELRPLVAQKLCVVTGQGAGRWVRMDASRSPELHRVEALFLADAAQAGAAALRLLRCGRHTYDEVRLRVASALRDTQDPLIRCLLVDAVVQKVESPAPGRAGDPAYGATALCVQPDAGDATVLCVQPGADGECGVRVTLEQVMRRAPKRAGRKRVAAPSARPPDRRGAPPVPPPAMTTAPPKAARRRASAKPAGERAKDTPA